ncbi:hypothetical protein [Streptomyces lomondensis]|uniref:Integral membrane protein n=1 Tax=Streptomyces lomondensis TaxID=68229 RepID=A0ABQ2XFN8_9ACTN|nr:hypothetical protein [Streptomyces lomondensis]MCF0077566.1 hypothetical protein [Streptomyces lomondensis]GGX14260.1 hypothetical protein GCM10010383_50430 [Streptomyces lomondensis]
MANAPKTRMPRILICVLALVALHALGSAFGGWAILEENRSKQEHGQDLLMPMGMAWFMALIIWGLAALQVACVVLARKRRAWVRVVLIVCLSLASVGTTFAFIGSLTTGAPSLAAFLLACFDIAAVWTVSGETGRAYFSVRAPAHPAPHPGV